jgi:hypothetical protein
MPHCFRFLWPALWFGCCAWCAPLRANDSSPSAQQLEEGFRRQIAPFLETYCWSCHGGKEPEAKLDLTGYTTLAAIVQDLPHWEVILRRLEAGEMPPDDAEQQPGAEKRREITEWIRRLRAHEAAKNAGDPGPVLARRLNNAEYDYTILDLTGIDIRPTREFPVDPANEAGFDNSGESLAMSPALLNKYLAAARHVTEHVVLKPDGLEWAPHAAVTDTDRDKYCVRRIVDFYERQPTDYAEYFFAAWRYRHRRALDSPDLTLSQAAREARLSVRYLETVWHVLHEPGLQAGPWTELREQWDKLPPATAPADAVRRGCVALRDFVIQERKRLTPPFQLVSIAGLSRSSQPVVLWNNRRWAEQRRRYLASADESLEAGEQAARERFCDVFPDTFYVSERARMFVDEDEQNKGRLLSAGFHLMVGYFRDDGPLYDLILDQAGRDELDRLWQELDFVAFAPLRQYHDFVFFERAEPPRFIEAAEFDFARAEDQDVIAQAKVDRLSKAYLSKLESSGVPADALEAVRFYFDDMSRQIRWVESARRAAEPRHLESLLEFAARAYRRPLAETECQSLLAFYHALREQHALDHEEAVRDTLVAILMSPHFCYRIDLPRAGSGPQPLADYALASRLSYFLWSSMPDPQLLAQARAGDLHEPEVLLAETRRLLRDPRSRRLAVEFGGNWLDFRRFQQHNSVDRQRFPAFDDELREAMFEEPIRFLDDIIRNNRSVLDCLYGRHTFVNRELAEHYGMPGPPAGSDQWVRVGDADQYGRGGLLPMSVFLTANSPGLRTSPVKRGYWVVRRLLGEQIPPPPPDVPELPTDEADLGELTLREILARHREIKNCAACHERFDSIGLVFEGYGPIGERRTLDLGGQPIDSLALFPDGDPRQGLPGLQDYVRDRRQPDFVDNLCRKFLAYALGRSLLLSDEPLLDAMRSELAADDYRFQRLVEVVVSSPQFLNQRGADDVGGQTK